MRKWYKYPIFFFIFAGSPDHWCVLPPKRPLSYLIIKLCFILFQSEKSRLLLSFYIPPIHITAQLHLKRKHSVLRFLCFQGMARAIQCSLMHIIWATGSYMHKERSRKRGHNQPWIAANCWSIIYKVRPGISKWFTLIYSYLSAILNLFRKRGRPERGLSMRTGHY